MMTCATFISKCSASLVWSSLAAAAGWADTEWTVWTERERGHQTETEMETETEDEVGKLKTKTKSTFMLSSSTSFNSPAITYLTQGIQNLKSFHHSFLRHCHFDHHHYSLLLQHCHQFPQFYHL